MRRANALWIVWLGLTSSCAMHPEPRPQPVAPQHSVADSAGAFGTTVEMLIADDSASAARVAADPRLEPEYPSLSRLLVRVGRTPHGAWAEPSVARLRAHHWFHKYGWAMDSTRALAQLEALSRLGSSPIPVELSLGLEFVGDTAYVMEYWNWQTCEMTPDTHVLVFARHLLARAPAGWRWVSSRGGTADLLC
ncbi:MAG: hypothetical protein DMD35_04590 [Gemmatimonadetes bacterium]|nr:MAG: hypothetical protein DMD35_04590 [Gemmatimonadota bacterium]